MFVVRVLGGLSVESTAASLPAEALQRRRLSLLALLTLAGERGLSRERIQSYLWPESESSRARHALDQLVYTTRRDLGYDLVISSATELRLSRAVVTADIWMFDEAIHNGRWEEAVGLYSGPVLDGQHLADCADLERWIDAERARSEHDHLRALDALADAATRREDVGDAVRWRRRRSAADPLSVPVALDLMRALEAANDRTGALRHARAFQQLITATLEVEPDPAVTGLANAIAERSGAVNTETVADILSAVTHSDRNDPDTLAPELPLAASPPAGVPRGRRAVVRLSAGVLALSGLAAVLVSRSHSLRSASTAGAEMHARTVSRNAGRVESSKPRGHQTTDPEARSLLFRARASWDKRTKEPLEEAVVLFRQAIERDPEYAAAYAGLAQSYAMLGYFGFAPADAMFSKARAAALRSIALDSTAGGDAYAALGQALAWQHAWSESEAAYQRALELSPADATAHQWYALLLAYLGRAREAAVHTGHASRLDPLSLQANNMHGMMLYYAGDLDGAMRQYERTVDAEPDSAWVRRNPWVLANFSRVAATAGRHALAVRLVERALEAVPAHPRPLFDLAFAYVAAGKPDSAQAAFARADPTHPHYAVYRALVHGLLGERDEAFMWFERVTEWPLPSLVTLSSEPRLARLRADPRFERIRARLNIPGPT
jgi:DNA-binding SARP family transcriptional activator/Flp pilus assembly protein TadD